jgi:ABC-type antimicrobial peptide transport system permease subunit
VAGLIAVGTGIGLVLSELGAMVMRVATAPAPGLGNITIYRPSVDPLALLAIAAITGIVGVAAAFVPGRRAAMMDPLVALRHE